MSTHQPEPPSPTTATIAHALPPDARASFVSVKSKAWRAVSGMRFRMAIDEVDLPPLPAHIIMVNIGRDVTLAEIAGVAHLSAFHFARMFKRSTGVSPHQYVIARRVERARNLLVDTALPLHEVAHRAGFADQSHLAKHTRRLLGGSPRALRMAAE